MATPKENVKDCSCTITRGREGEKGSWCVSCGKKVLEVEERECQECKHFQTDLRGSICKKLLMFVIPSMHVTYKINEGTCFTK